MNALHAARRFPWLLASLLLVLLPCIAQANPLLEGPPPGDELKPGAKISGEDRNAVNLVLTGYSERAAQLYRPFLDHATFKTFAGMAPFLIAIGPDGNTAPVRILDVKFDDPDRIIDPRVTTLAFPAGSARIVQAPYWPVPGYGVAWLRADNGGAGYQMTKPGLMVLNLNFEFARTHLRLVIERAKSLPGRDLSDAVRRQLDAASKALNNAKAATGAERARFADEALNYALRAGEDLELDIARSQIPAARHGRVTVRVTTPGGAPVDGAAVTFKQVSRDFLFGVVESFGFITSKPGEAGFNRIFGSLRDAGFNHYTVSMFWDQLEQQPGRYRFADWEALLGVKEAVSAGMSLKMHALLQESVPKHVKEMDAGGFAAANRQYFDAATRRFGSENGLGSAVSIWQAANEPSTNHYGGHDEVRKIELLRGTTSLLRARAPGSKVLINDVYADWGQRWDGKPGPGGHKVVSPIEMFEAFNKAGIDYDLIGLEWYPGLRVNFFDLLQFQGPLQDFASTSASLDRYARLGKPLHITEFAVPSSWNEDWKSGWWREKWSPQVQADYVERFYTIAFSKKHVREITYWGISDNEPWVITGGLMSKDYKPKPVLDRLSELFRKWSSGGMVRTDRAGNAMVTGFAGDYDVVVEKDGRRKAQRIHVDEQRSGNVSIVLDR